MAGGGRAAVNGLWSLPAELLGAAAVFALLLAASSCSGGSERAGEEDREAWLAMSSVSGSRLSSAAVAPHNKRGVIASHQADGSSNSSHIHNNGHGQHTVLVCTA